MPLIVTLLFLIAFLPLATGILVFVVEIVAAWAPQQPALPVLPICGVRPRVAVLMPAHDEQAGIGATLSSVLPTLAAGDRLLVVADNCSDDTAAVARAAGAEVHERRDSLRRGKGYALDFGLQVLSGAPPDVVIVIDADCRVAADAIDRLARQAASSGRPAQACYLMLAPAPARGLRSIAEFAFVVKNLGRPLGLQRLGLPTQLTGSGMAFPCAAIERVSFASGHLAEDMELGLALARAGMPAAFCADALVTSLFPSNRTGSQTQRTRWEHGHLGLILRDAPALLRQAVLRRDGALLGLALDLMVPPLALLVTLTSFMLGVAALLWLLLGLLTPMLVAGGALMLLASAVLLAWWRFGRQVVSVGDLFMAFPYLLGKLAVYRRFVGKRETAWVRSQRDSER